MTSNQVKEGLIILDIGLKEQKHLNHGGQLSNVAGTSFAKALVTDKLSALLFKIP